MNPSSNPTAVAISFPLIEKFFRIFYLISRLYAFTTVLVATQSDFWSRKNTINIWISVRHVISCGLIFHLLCTIHETSSQLSSTDSIFALFQ